jgi:hypothetical protein
LTNAEIDDISTTDDYKEQLGKIKQLIGENWTGSLLNSILLSL